MWQRKSQHSARAQAMSEATWFSNWISDLGLSLDGKETESQHLLAAPTKFNMNSETEDERRKEIGRDERQDAAKSAVRR